LCREKDKPCLSCGPCRKVAGALHPDFITVDDPEKKTVPVDLIRSARADIYIQPNEAEYKIYLFPRAQDMQPPAQNALLKILEEPPKYGVFILLTDNPEKLLPTVRSRCTELALTALPEDVLTKALEREFPKAEPEMIRSAVVRSGGFLGQAKELLESGSELPPQTEGFCRSFATADAMGLVQVLSPMEKWKRDQLIPILRQWLELTENALASRAGIPVMNPLAGEMASKRSPLELMDAIGKLQTCLEYAQSNVSPAAICGYLAWALR